MPRTAAPPETDIREGSEDEMQSKKRKPSRKRSAKNADNTSPPEGDCDCSPEDKAKGECECGPKAKDDSECGNKRSDSISLTPASLLRYDLKCGKGAISEGEKCHKGPATRVQQKPKATRSTGGSKPGLFQRNFQKELAPLKAVREKNALHSWFGREKAAGRIKQPYDGREIVNKYVDSRAYANLRKVVKPIQKLENERTVRNTLIAGALVGTAAAGAALIGSRKGKARYWSADSVWADGFKPGM